MGIINISFHIVISCRDNLWNVLVAGEERKNIIKEESIEYLNYI